MGVEVLLNRAQALLLVVDIQSRLAPAIANADEVVGNAARLLQGSARLDVPAWVSEQYVQGLGATVEALQPHLVAAWRFEKIHFSCLKEDGLHARLLATGRRQIVVCGTETHVCVLQTVLDLLALGFAVFVVADAIGSRTPANREAGIERMRAAGAVIVTTEMVLFEWLERAGTGDFRAVLPLIK
jgi:nicotinamidase-related amidase